VGHFFVVVREKPFWRVLSVCAASRALGRVTPLAIPLYRPRGGRSGRAVFTQKINRAGNKKPPSKARWSLVAFFASCCGRSLAGWGRASQAKRS